MSERATEGVWKIAGYSIPWRIGTPRPTDRIAATIINIGPERETAWLFYPATPTAPDSTPARPSPGPPQRRSH